MRLENQAALVTGGASGLGRAAAKRLGDQGVRVVVFDRDGVGAERVAGEIRGLAVAGDIANRLDVEAAIAQAASAFGEPPRIVVSCAGIGTAARILPRDGSLTIDAFAETVRVNLVGAYVVLSVAALAMSALPPLGDDGERGVVINTASVAYQDGQIGQAAYAASKGGIASLTLPAARELARIGVRVVTIAPGLFETPMSDGLSDDVKEALKEQVPFPHRMGDPSEFAQLAAHVVENPFLNGTVIRLDGAARMPAR